MSKTAKLVTYLVRAFVLIVLSLVGNHVMGYIFSVPINSSSIISIDYNIQRSSRAPKRPKSIPQGRLVFISCLINTNKTVKQDGPSTFQGSKWFLHVLHEKVQQQLVPDSEREVHGWIEWSLQTSREEK